MLCKTYFITTTIQETNWSPITGSPTGPSSGGEGSSSTRSTWPSSTLNYILYLMSPCSSKRLTHSQFRVELAKQLLMEEVIPVEEPEGRPLGPHLDPNPPSSRLTGRHFPGKLGSTTAGHQRQQQCVVCSHKKGRGRTTTTYKCKQYHLPMCVVLCFELYRTRTHSERYL